MPMLIAGPNIAPGIHYDMTSLLDVFPTLCDLASVPLPDFLHGQVRWCECFAGLW